MQLNISISSEAPHVAATGLAGAFGATSPTGRDAVEVALDTDGEKLTNRLINGVTATAITAYVEALGGAVELSSGHIVDDELIEDQSA